MDLNNLSAAFSKIEKKINLHEYLQEVCLAIINKDVSRKEINEILKDFNVSLSVAKVDFLHLIFEYIKVVFEDNLLSTGEKENIKFLKLLFSVEPGDFYLHNKIDMVSTITCQLSRIYDNCYVNDEEALLKVGLQEIFDLSFDQMNDYAKLEASGLIHQGVDSKNLDVFFTHEEYFRLK